MIIYTITNKEGEIKYVGQTVQPLKERVYKYRDEIKRAQSGRISTRPMIAAMIKYGMESFSFEIIDTADNYDSLNEKEIYWIEKLQTHTTKKGYNVELGGSNSPKSEETKRKISEAQKGIPKPHTRGKNHALSKRLIELTTGKVFDSAEEADRELNIKGSSRVARGDRGSVHGYVFRYIDEEEKIQFNNSFMKTNKGVKDRVKPEYQKYVETNGTNSGIAKSVKFIPTGEIFPSMAAASRGTGRYETYLKNYRRRTKNLPKDYEFVGGDV